MDGKKLEYKGVEALKELERLTIKAGEVQEQILTQILSQNCHTHYLSKYYNNNNNCCNNKLQLSHDLFKKNVPLVTYKDIYPYILRIANGDDDSNLLTAHPITEMLSSSGTSAGEPKLMPSIAEDLDRRTFVYNLIMPIINQYVDGLDEGKAMYLYFVKAETSTACGIPARTVLTSYYKSSHFKHRPHDPFNDFTSSDAAILCHDSDQSMYCQLLAGLIHRRRVLRLGAVFASALLRAISFLERHWREFCRDIRAGELSVGVSDAACRLAMADLLRRPDPDAADEIENICRQSWKGIVCRLWPNAKYIEAVVTGSMSQYVPALKFYSDDRLPLVCPMYASSECYFGVNLKPLCPPSEVSFTLLPNMAYFEFLPLAEDGKLWMAFEDDDDTENDNETAPFSNNTERAPFKNNNETTPFNKKEAAPFNSKLVDLVNVKVGCYYELVVTTFSGLYRYRIGDVLQVTGFHNEAPQFRFICRRNVVLSIDCEKTNEEDLHRSITAAAKSFLEPRGALLVEYTSYADATSVPGHYVLFWEIKSTVAGTNLAAWVLNECCIAVEEGLDYVYRRCRTNDKSVGPLEIRWVKGGTFEKLMDLSIAQGGASINQYKTPRCVKSKAFLKLLNANVSESYFSPRDPVWNP
ncbi:putative indole-3-acetic acid-amido synthetase GH3.9 isoform X2 [Andrographis paniculata]|uniref:putative indole-3-acetic acid-amido synthetase GH3.9 isoform X2 n=1 Tax=Andrographis paniculata TaxID=175694 RepID=UPI0021E794AC|nr:putative indole-3-acetic acid-amido synthetase GH3.9 isoform X2 [Andrographis paniculata]